MSMNALKKNVGVIATTAVLLTLLLVVERSYTVVAFESVTAAVSSTGTQFGRYGRRQNLANLVPLDPNCGSASAAVAAAVATKIGSSSNSALSVSPGGGVYTGKSLAVASPAAPAAAGSISQHHDRLARSVVMASACMITNVLATFTPLSPIQASSLLGIFVCAIASAPPATAAATFSGAFTGMSAHVLAVAKAVDSSSFSYPIYTVSLLLLSGLGASVFYLFDVQKIGVGKGGRLGAIAVVANVIYTFAIMRARVWETLFPALGRPTARVAVAVGASSLGMVLVRKTMTTTTNSKGDPDTAATNFKTLQTLLLSACKIALFGTLFAQLLDKSNAATPIWLVFEKTENVARLLAWSRTFAAMLLGSTIVQKSSGVVFPAALVGFGGSLIRKGVFAGPLFAGAFMGMTNMPKYSWTHRLQGIALAATLFQLGLFDGFGGKLGLFSYLGVYFGMV